VTAWYEEAFGRDYLMRYPHRDDEEARRNIEGVTRLLDPPRDKPLLDLCCGAGRHLLALHNAGYRDLTGVDLSQALLDQARARLHAQRIDGVRLVRADMREIPSNLYFFTVLSLFTSFGYFADEREDECVLRGVHRALYPGGAFLLDTMNRDQVIATLVPRQRHAGNGRRLDIRRRITRDGQRVEKITRVFEPGAPIRSVRESVRMYTRTEMEQMLRAAGFVNAQFFGGLDGTPFSKQSPRMVIKACKEYDENA
jgi:SAM-dependent methyltransferase